VGESGWNWSSPCSNIVWNMVECFLPLLLLLSDGYWVDVWPILLYSVVGCWILILSNSYVDSNMVSM
jgi:hypothetical protein